MNKYAGAPRRRPVELFFRRWGGAQEARARRRDLPEVFEGRVDVEAAAVHVSDIGGRQLHLRDGQTCPVILGQKKRDGDP